VLRCQVGKEWSRRPQDVVPTQESAEIVARGEGGKSALKSPRSGRHVLKIESEDIELSAGIDVGSSHDAIRAVVNLRMQKLAAVINAGTIAASITAARIAIGTATSERVDRHGMLGVDRVGDVRADVSSLNPSSCKLAPRSTSPEVLAEQEEAVRFMFNRALLLRDTAREL